MYSYHQIEHTADAGFDITAGSSKELFQAAGEALFSLVADPSEVGNDEMRNVEISGDNLEDLVFNFLRELVFLLAVDGLVFTTFQVDSLHGDAAKIGCTGGRVPRSAPHPELEIKAVTYHGFRVEEHGGQWYARFIVDV